MDRLKNISRVVITDDTEFEAGMCCNGGHYRYETVFTRHGDEWRRKFRTSAEFELCPVYGHYEQCRHCPSEGWCLRYEVVTEAEVASAIDEANTDTSECRYYPGEKALSVALS